MKELRIPLEGFDLEALLERAVNFLKSQVSQDAEPNYGIVWVQSLGDVAGFGAESGWDALTSLVGEGKMVFFPFAYADADGTLACANGETCRPAADGEHSGGERLSVWKTA